MVSWCYLVNSLDFDLLLVDTKRSSILDEFANYIDLFARTFAQFLWLICWILVSSLAGALDLKRVIRVS